ncbi:MAG: SET domain-containing protein-lysine N-methyltransferase [Gammaproteobacteria bacterium]|nr:SET domain-containing protein-lysine N-methyltransferase [Gammaproteobacteria bacterium]
MAIGNEWQSEHFEIDESTIENAGMGLYSKVNIKSGDTIGPYTGMILTDEEVEQPPYSESDYVLWVCKDCNIVGEGPKANYVRYINHHDEPNCRIVSSNRWKKARIEAIRKIKPGQEIFIDYGPYYWEHFSGAKAPDKPTESGAGLF